MSETAPQLMEDHEKHQMKNDSARAAAARWDYPLAQCRWLVEDTARRVRESKELFSHEFFRGDCHSHTQHSDGIGTVAETAEMARAAQLDFQFVTDHWGVTQAPECRKNGLWFGQEPVTKDHHLGILGLDFAFAPQMDFLEDYAAVTALGATAFVPHPTGWWPSTIYNDAQKALLHQLPGSFLMEICNGAHNLVSAFDFTDDNAIALWDELLLSREKGDRDGQHRRTLSARHRHHLERRLRRALRAESDPARNLRLATVSVSEAPLIYLALGDARMGDVASASDRANALRTHAVDSRGLSSVRVLADGEEVFYRHFRGDVTFENDLEVPAKAARYVRVEVRGVDGKRAYSQPDLFRVNTQRVRREWVSTRGGFDCAGKSEKRCSKRIG